jgi:hypothetical protein
VERLLNTLLVCFQDDSWPVRDGEWVWCWFLVHSTKIIAGLQHEQEVPITYGS